MELEEEHMAVWRCDLEILKLGLSLDGRQLCMCEHHFEKNTCWRYKECDEKLAVVFLVLQDQLSQGNIYRGIFAYFVENWYLLRGQLEVHSSISFSLIKHYLPTLQFPRSITGLEIRNRLSVSCICLNYSIVIQRRVLNLIQMMLS